MIILKFPIHFIFIEVKEKSTSKPDVQIEKSTPKKIHNILYETTTEMTVEIEAEETTFKYPPSSGIAPFRKVFQPIFTDPKAKSTTTKPNSEISKSPQKIEHILHNTTTTDMVETMTKNIFTNNPREPDDDDVQETVPTDLEILSSTEDVLETSTTAIIIEVEDIFDTTTTDSLEEEEEGISTETTTDFLEIME